MQFGERCSGKVDGGDNDSGDAAMPLRDIFPTVKLIETGEACSICHKRLEYSNSVITCPHSALRICMRCCKEMICSCEDFNNKNEILHKINEAMRTFSYRL